MRGEADFIPLPQGALFNAPCFRLSLAGLLPSRARLRFTENQNISDDTILTILPNETSYSEARHNWARLIQKIYEVDPLVCSKCQGQMKIIFIIDGFEIVDKILKYLNLWDVRNHDQLEIEPVYIPELTYVEDSDYDNSGSQIPVFDTFWSRYF